MLTLKHDKSGHIRKEYSRFFPDRLSHAIFLTAFNNSYTISSASSMSAMMSLRW